MLMHTDGTYSLPAPDACPLAFLGDTSDHEALAEMVAEWHDYPDADMLAHYWTA